MAKRKKKSEKPEKKEEKYYIGQLPSFGGHDVIIVENEEWETLEEVIDYLINYQDLTPEQLEDMVIFKGEKLMPKIGSLRANNVDFLSEEDPRWEEE